jgi:uncharacterized membrane protein SirB2
LRFPPEADLAYFNDSAASSIFDQLIASPTHAWIKSFILHLKRAIALYRTVLILSGLILLSLCKSWPLSRSKSWLVKATVQVMVTVKATVQVMATVKTTVQVMAGQGYCPR